MNKLQNIQSHTSKVHSAREANLFQKLLAQSFSNEEVEAQVLSGLEALPSKYRQVILLHYFNNQSIQNIQATIGKSESTVRNRLSYGLYLLKQQITQS